MDTLIERLRAVQVSSLCDADKGLAVVDPAIRAMVSDVSFAGPAFTLLAYDDHLPVLAALREAEPGSVLVVATNSLRKAVSGELFATEAQRRGIAAIVIDGYCRDLRGLRRIGLPVHARGTTPMSGTTRDPGTFGREVLLGRVRVSPGDLVVGDDDGVVVGPRERFEAAIDAAEEIERAEKALVAGMAGGRALHDMTNVEEHLEALGREQPSALRFLV
ncbi:RraA family protein [Pseudonocardia xishanensis]|uniref:Putative 4-hydroxy-4-methyl-2-oxoglutarate aldolase n=1 Tax=Pseudonocardia xishanensis TaxID=630995 RepID=A0ABP8RWA3_9PSEU